MTIQELIDALQALPQKDRDIVILDADTDWLLPIEYVGPSENAPPLMCVDPGHVIIAGNY